MVNQLQTNNGSVADDEYSKNLNHVKDLLRQLDSHIYELKAPLNVGTKINNILDPWLPVTLLNELERLQSNYSKHLDVDKAVMNNAIITLKNYKSEIDAMKKRHNVNIYNTEDKKYILHNLNVMHKITQLADPIDELLKQIRSAEVFNVNEEASYAPLGVSNNSINNNNFRQRRLNASGTMNVSDSDPTIELLNEAAKDLIMLYDEETLKDKIHAHYDVIKNKVEFEFDGSGNVENITITQNQTVLPEIYIDLLANMYYVVESRDEASLQFVLDSARDIVNKTMSVTTGGSSSKRTGRSSPKKTSSRASHVPPCTRKQANRQTNNTGRRRHPGSSSRVPSSTRRRTTRIASPKNASPPRRRAQSPGAGKRQTKQNNKKSPRSSPRK